MKIVADCFTLTIVPQVVDALHSKVFFFFFWTEAYLFLKVEIWVIVKLPNHGGPLAVHWHISIRVED